MSEGLCQTDLRRAAGGSFRNTAYVLTVPDDVADDDPTWTRQRLPIYTGLPNYLPHDVRRT